MEFRTKVNIPHSEVSISHQDKILAFGSCFSENIGNFLINNKFNINSNPFGILYNPISISQAIKILIEEKQFTEKDLFFHNGLYHSFWHHGDFSSTDRETCLNLINSSLKTASSDIRKANFLIITFGTSYVFRFKELNTVVGNCHKLPSSNFDRYRLNIREIVNEWSELIARIAKLNPTLQIIFTVSPIRHIKDGAHDNQLSKSTLLLAIDQLIQENRNTNYFPSYEIVLDELRDYRFYNEDMVHPSYFAIKYIWEKFSESYFNEQTIQINKEWTKIYNSINHRPINSESEEYKVFLKQTLLKLKAFNKKYPYICCENEINNLEKTLL